MFKLKKILNSGTNVPEPVCFKNVNGETYAPGSPVAFSAGALVKIGSGSTPSAQYMVISSDINKVLCYAISPDMIFETEGMTGIDDCYEGDFIGFFIDDDGNCIAASAGNGDELILYNRRNYSALGDKIQVKFRYK